jgi:hypothetical protein
MAHSPLVPNPQWHLPVHLGYSQHSGTACQQAHQLVARLLNGYQTPAFNGADTALFVETAARRTAGLTMVLEAAEAAAADSTMQVFLMLEEKAAAGLALLTLRLFVLIR